MLSDSGAYIEVFAAICQARLALDQKERAADEIRKDLEMAGLEADQYLADQVRIDMQLKAVAQEHKREEDSLSKKQKEKERLLRKYKKAELAVKQLQGNESALKNMLTQAHHQLQQIEAERKKTQTEEQELKRVVAIHISNYLQKEAAG